MIVVCRFREDERGGDALRAELEHAHRLLSERPGYLGGEIGRATDDPGLWVLITRWVYVGAYRRALSSFEIKAEAVPILSRALDEPTAFEQVREGETLNVTRARGDV